MSAHAKRKVFGNSLLCNGDEAKLFYQQSFPKHFLSRTADGKSGSLEIVYFFVVWYSFVSILVRRILYVEYELPARMLRVPIIYF